VELLLIHQIEGFIVLDGKREDNCKFISDDVRISKNAREECF